MTKKTSPNKKKPAAKKAVDDNIYWVVLEKRPFWVKVVGLKRSRNDAYKLAEAFDNASSYTFNRFVVQRAELTDGPK